MYKQEDPEVNLGQALGKIRGLFGRIRAGGGGGGAIVYGALLVILIAGAVWLATGFYTVSTVGGEVSVLRLFGKFHSIKPPGLHWFWPSPVGTMTIVREDERRRLELGFRSNQQVPEESLMITGDENIVDVQLLVQYNIKSPVNFLFNVVDPDGVTIRDAAETSLRQSVGSRPIDDVLTDQKESIQVQTKKMIQALLDEYGAGIHITEVKLQNVNPPEQVQDAFADVVRAKEDKEKIINLADAYKEDILPRARGTAASLREAAEAFKAQRINIASGQADRFTAMLAEYRKSKDVTRKRLYLEAMEAILPDITKNIVPPGSDIVIVNSSGSQIITPLPGEGNE